MRAVEINELVEGSADERSCLSMDALLMSKYKLW